MSTDAQDITGDHILLVDDSHDNILVMAKILDCFGCTYDTALNGADAVKLVREKDYRFVLMDMHMPVMDGIVATRMIRSWEKSTQGKRNIIIGVTGYPTVHDDGDSFRRAGMDDYIAKPFRMQDLKQKMLSCKT